MKQIVFFLMFIMWLAASALAQDTDLETQPFRFHLGVQTRVTPIYVKGAPNFSRVVDRNIWEQPDMHLSGPAFVYSIEGKVAPSWSVVFSQALRYDLLYWTQPFNNQPYEGFKVQKKRTFITELYLDAERTVALNNSSLFFGGGLALCGLGSGYLITQRFTDNNNESFYVSSKEDFIFPAVSVHFGWQKSRFKTSLKMGYAWHNPTVFDTPFLFPEIKAQYRLFSF